MASLVDSSSLAQDSNCSESPARAIDRPPVTGWYAFLISLFVIAYVVIAINWLWPEPKWAQKFMSMASPVVTKLGLEENWRLFSPDIKTINMDNTALIRYANGFVKLYEWPRMEKLDLAERARREKYRKFFIDCIPWPNCAAFQPTVARFLARANANPDNPPVTVSLEYSWTTVPPFEQWASQKDLPENTTFYTTSIYAVTPEDLK